jgi:hypothetical protein
VANYERISSTNLLVKNTLNRKDNLLREILSQSHSEIGQQMQFLNSCIHKNPHFQIATCDCCHCHCAQEGCIFHSSCFISSLFFQKIKPKHGLRCKIDGKACIIVTVIAWIVLPETFIQFITYLFRAKFFKPKGTQSHICLDYILRESNKWTQHRTYYFNSHMKWSKSISSNVR